MDKGVQDRPCPARSPSSQVTAYLMLLASKTSVSETAMMGVAKEKAKDGNLTKLTDVSLVLEEACVCSTLLRMFFRINGNFGSPGVAEVGNGGGVCQATEQHTSVSQPLYFQKKPFCPRFWVAVF